MPTRSDPFNDIFERDAPIDDWKAGRPRIACELTSPDELTPVDWRTLEPLEQKALDLAGHEQCDAFCAWFDARWKDRLPVWATPKYDTPSDSLLKHAELWEHEVACYWGTLTPEQRREHPAWKLAEDYAHDRAWCEAEAAKAEGLA